MKRLPSTGQPVRNCLDAHTLSPLEERVLRMRQGMASAPQTRLSEASCGHDDLRVQLARIEAQVLGAAARRRRASLRLVPPPADADGGIVELCLPRR